MRGLIVDRDRPTGVRLDPRRPDPSPGPGEVLIRVHRAGICSTDLEIARGYMGFSGVLGHEFVGTVVRGSDVLSGRRVVTEINCTGPGVAADAETRKHHVPRTVIGLLGRDGAFADFLIAPAENCHVVPPSISDAQAVFVEPLAAAVQITRDAAIVPGQRATVLGSGRLGILCGLVLADAGCHVDVVGRNPVSLAKCRELGLVALHVDGVTGAAPVDLLVECTGSPAGLALAQRLVRPRGTIVLKSTYAAGEPIDLSPTVIHELRIVGSRCGPFDAALRLLVEQRVAVEPLISAVFPLDRAEHAFAAAADPRNIKVQITMEPE